MRPRHMWLLHRGDNALSTLLLAADQTPFTESDLLLPATSLAIYYLHNSQFAKKYYERRISTVEREVKKQIPDLTHYVCCGMVWHCRVSGHTRHVITNHSTWLVLAKHIGLCFNIIIIIIIKTLDYSRT